MNWTLASILTDIALGGMAYNLAWKLSRIQEKQTHLLDALMRRVDRLELNGHAKGPAGTPLGFIPIPNREDDR